MWKIRDHISIGISAGLIVSAVGCVNAWAVVVPYPFLSDLTSAEKVEAEKRDIIKRIEDLKKQDIWIVKEIRTDLKQMDEKEGGKLPQNKDCEERH